MPAISIIIPVYNASRYLLETIRSVQNQTFRDWELLLVDDGSTDDSYQICTDAAKNDSRLKVIQKHNGGVGSARNTGYLAAAPDSEFFAFLDNDDIWVPTALSVLHEALEKRPYACASVGRISLIDQNGESIPHIFNKTEHVLGSALRNNSLLRPLDADEDITHESFLISNMIRSPGCVLFRRIPFERVGGFRQDTTFIDDWCMYVDITKTAPMTGVSHEVLEYRQHGANVSTRISEMYSEIRQFRRNLIRSSQLPKRHLTCVLLGYRATELHHGLSKLPYVFSELHRGSIKSAISQTKFAAGHLLRYVIGRP